MIKNGQDFSSEKTDEKKLYELSFLLTPSLGEVEVAEALFDLTSHIEKRGGVIRGTTAPLMRELAYPMAKVTVGHREEHTSAYFGWIFFEAEPAMIATLSQEINMKASVIRPLLVETVEEAISLSEKAARRQEERDAPAPKEEKVLSEVELDKTIENLVIE